MDHWIFLIYLLFCAAFIVLTLKNLGLYLSFEVVIKDDKGFKRRFRASNYQVCASSFLFGTPHDPSTSHPQTLTHNTIHAGAFGVVLWGERE